MKSQHARIYALTVGIILLSLTLTNAARAQDEQATREFLAASGFLCTTPPCFDIASTGPGGSGDTIAISGSGTFTPGTDKATGSGTFTQTLAGGSVTGTWTVKELVSFVSFGTASPASSIEGGTVVLEVQLTPSGGVGLDAVLTITCTAGSSPPTAIEGITLNVEGGPNFSNTVPGPAVFIITPSD